MSISILSPSIVTEAAFFSVVIFPLIVLYICATVSPFFAALSLSIIRCSVLSASSSPLVTLVTPSIPSMISIISLLMLTSVSVSSPYIFTESPDAINSDVASSEPTVISQAIPSVALFMLSTSVLISSTVLTSSSGII